MGDRKTRTRIRCRVDEFPDEIRARLDGRLKDTKYTYQDIADELTEIGYPISKSSIHRYAMRTSAAAARLKEASEQTRQLIEMVRDNQDVEASEVAAAVLMDGITRRLATAEDEFDKLPIDKAGNLLVQLQRSGVYKNRWKQDRKKTIDSLQAALLDKIRDAVQDDDELLTRLTDMVVKAAKEEADKDDQ